MKQYAILVINSGSSSVKFQVIEPASKKTLIKGLLENIRTDRCYLTSSLGQKALPFAGYEEAIKEVCALIKGNLSSLIGIGHRIVHGGERFFQSTLIDDEVMRSIENLKELAPLHQEAHIAGIKALKKEFPGLPHVAVLDTAFHQSMPKRAFLYAIPEKFYEKYHVRRYGFHGTSHRYVLSQASKYFEEKQTSQAFVSAHLGNGCSVCASLDGKSVDTSMGMTPLEGLVMGQRSGDLDPSIIGYLSEKEQRPPAELITILNNRSGLLALSKVGADMRLIEEEAQKGNQSAALAIEIFCYRLAKYIGSYLVPLQKIDGLIFTGGIGENSELIREKVVNMLGFLNLSIDTSRNKVHGKNSNGIISVEGQRPLVMVIPTNEELLIALDTEKVIQDGGSH